MRDFTRISEVCNCISRKYDVPRLKLQPHISVALLHVTPFWIAPLSARLSHESWERMDFGNADWALMCRLELCGDEDAKGLRGIKFTLLIEAPRYWWQEMDTYTIGVTCLGSTSTMHKEAKRLKDEDLVKAKSELKEGTLQLRCREFSLPTLERIIKQRHNHRLPE